MEDYYSVVFFLLIFLQDHFKGFLTTLTCFVMVKTNLAVTAYLQMIGCTYYEAMMFYEAIVFAFSIFLIGCRLGVMLCVVSTISFTLNFIGYLSPNGLFYQWYYTSYNTINIVMFEILVWACLINSRLKPYLKNPNKILIRQSMVGR